MSLISRLRGNFPIWFLLLALTIRPAPAADLIDQWIGAQTNLQTWSAKIVETRSFKTLSQPLVSTGQVWVAIPDRFRWELGQPPQTIAIRSPEELTLVYPRLKRAEKYPLGPHQTGPWKDALALLEASFPRSRANLEAHFQILGLVQTNGIAILSLRPASASARKFITRLTISFQAQDFSPAATELTFSDGSSLRNDFSDGQVNPPLDPQLFVPKLEPDFSVVEPMK